MVRRAFKPEQIINKLREAEVLLSQGSTVGEASRKLGVTEQTYYRWRKEYSGMGVEQARRLKELEKENTRLKRVLIKGMTLVLGGILGNRKNQNLLASFQTTNSFRR